jgi:folylpolyglutamate synthase/dihydrofolate synthase
MEYGEAVDLLESRVSKPDDFGFDTFRQRVESRGHPQDFDVVHVAGTNGKGSCCTFIAAMLQNAGYSVGLFTGPHLAGYTDRIRVDGTPIPADRFASLFARIQDTSFSMFESMVVMALMHFAEEAVDIAVIETGLGGRRDATNIVDPTATVITNVTREHTDVLGNTIPEIAREKAGIIAPGTPVITQTTPPAREVIAAEARARDAPVIVPDTYASLAGTGPLQLSLAGRQVKPRVRGRYQVENINTAIETVRQLPREVDDAAVVRALETVTIPGRMEVVARDPQIILDGAHNRAGIDALAASIDQVSTVVFGCMDTKPYEAMINHLAPTTDRFIFTRPDTDDAAAPETLAAVADGQVIRDPEEAVMMAEQSAADTVLVTGSMYLVRTIRPLFDRQAPVIGSQR